MSTHRLDRLFAPRMVAVIGASPRPGSLGGVLLRSLRASAARRKVYAVNPKHRSIDGLPCFASVEALPEVPDLIVVTTPPSSVSGIIAAAGAAGVAAAVVITAGLGHGPGSLLEKLRTEARRYGLRLVGPNCLGIMAPYADLNASFAASAPLPGGLAVISQSGAIAAGLVEWAAGHRIGFSSIVSLGDMADVDFGDCLDYFAADPATRAILLYVESITDAPKFMSAARAASRAKPVFVLKAGRHAQGARAAATHTGALAGSDAVYDAAFRRAGLLRILDLDELLSAVEALTRQNPFSGRRLAVLTNGGGLGVLAVDRLNDLGGELAELSGETRARLDAALPANWSHANPVDIIGDADAGRYTVALEALLDDEASDAVLVLQIATALAQAEDAAHAVVETIERRRKSGLPAKPVFAVWLGAGVAVSRLFEAAGIAHFGTEAQAILGFMHFVRYSASQEELTATPECLPDIEPRTAAARAIVKSALANGHAWLDPLEVYELLSAYDIPVVPSAIARNAAEAVAAARPFLEKDGRVVLKILSPDIVHKSEVGGVQLGLDSEGAVRQAASDMLARVAQLQPQARIDGLLVQPMLRRPQARELILGIADDPVFGPVVLFGEGGTAVEIIDDKALAFPPLDRRQARELVARPRIARRLAAYRNVAAIDHEALEQTLVKLARMAVDLPQVAALDINPLLADDSGVIAIDARVAVHACPDQDGVNPRLAIRPYPHQWVRTVTTQGGQAYSVRPIRAEDEAVIRHFLEQVSPEDLRLRFFGRIAAFDHAFLARLVQLDYARAIAFLALCPQTGEPAGVARLHADADHRIGRFAILIRSDLKGTGLGWALMGLVIEWAKAENLAAIEGEVLRENTPMLSLCRELGFEITPDADDRALARVVLMLTSPL